jgi:hypothetical protein
MSSLCLLNVMENLSMADSKWDLDGKKVWGFPSLQYREVLRRQRWDWASADIWHNDQEKKIMSQKLDLPQSNQKLMQSSVNWAPLILLWWGRGGIWAIFLTFLNLGFLLYNSSEL